MKRVDSLNVARLMEITEKHGWQERAWIILVASKRNIRRRQLRVELF